ncbi:HP0495 family protein [Halomonas sp. LS-001]
MKSNGKQTFRDMRQPQQNGGKSHKITFPCDYPIKVVGDAADDFAAVVCQIVVTYAPDFDADGITVVDSRNGRFQSIRLSIQATSEEQINQLFLALKATGRVHMVL